MADNEVRWTRPEMCEQFGRSTNQERASPHSGCGCELACETSFGLSHGCLARLVQASYGNNADVSARQWPAMNGWRSLHSSSSWTMFESDAALVIAVPGFTMTDPSDSRTVFDLAVGGNASKHWREHKIKDLLRRHAGAHADRLIFAGHSLGATIAARLACKFVGRSPRRPEVVLFESPGLPADLLAECNTERFMTYNGQPNLINTVLGTNAILAPGRLVHIHPMSSPQVRPLAAAWGSLSRAINWFTAGSALLGQTRQLARHLVEQDFLEMGGVRALLDSGKLAEFIFKTVTNFGAAIAEDHDLAGIVDAFEAGTGPNSCSWNQSVVVKWPSVFHQLVNIIWNLFRSEFLLFNKANYGLHTLYTPFAVYEAKMAGVWGLQEMHCA